MFCLAAFHVVVFCLCVLVRQCLLVVLGFVCEVPRRVILYALFFWQFRPTSQVQIESQGVQLLAGTA